MEVQDMFPDDDTLSAARRMVMRDRWPVNRGGAGGVICPCCDGRAYVYPRKFNKTMARVLVQMYRWDCSAPGKWHHVHNEWPLKNERFNNEYARMVDYNLIEPANGVRPDGNPDNGYHRITQLGREFVEGKVKVPARHLCYKGRVLEESEELWDISDCIGEPFNYMELFGGK